MDEGRRLLPPMAALTSFVAAARHGGFSRAGEQVGLTQSAVSRQIALLEEWLQMPLFDRHGRRVALNAAGQAYADQIGPALDRIRSATRQALMQRGGRELTIATLPSFGMRWLAPRLPDLSVHYPDLTVNFAARSFPFDLVDEGFDGAIHFGKPDWPDASHLFLFREEAVVVCSADWMRRNAIREPRDLIGKPLLFQASRRQAWQHWFSSCGMDDATDIKGAVFEHFLMLSQAAAAGAGAALIPRFLIGPELEAGALVTPFGQALSTDEAYYLVRRQGWESLPALVEFSSWLEAQVKDLRGQP